MFTQLHLIRPYGHRVCTRVGRTLRKNTLIAIGMEFNILVLNWLCSLAVLLVTEPSALYIKNHGLGSSPLSTKLHCQSIQTGVIRVFMGTLGILQICDLCRTSTMGSCLAGAFESMQHSLTPSPYVRRGVLKGFAVLLGSILLCITRV